MRSFKAYILEYQEAILISAVTVISLLIKVPFLSEMGIWGDEAFSIFYAQQTIAEMNVRLQEDVNPPLYYLLLHFWINIFGTSPVAVKMLSVIFSVGTSITLYKLGELIQGRFTAWVSLILYLLSDLHFDFSHEVRTYSLVCFSALLSYYIYFSISKNFSWRKLLLLSLLNTILAYSHFIALLIPLTQILSTLIINRKYLFQLMVSQLLTLLLIVPMIIQILDVKPDEGFWLSKPTSFDFFYVLTKVIGHDNLKYFFLAMLLISILMTFNKIRERFFNKELKAYIPLFLFLWFLIPIILDFVIAQYIPVFRLRYVLYASFPLYLCAPFVIYHIKIPNYLKPGIITFILLSAAISFNPANRDVEQWDRVSSLLKERNEPETSLVLVNAKFKIREIGYYFDRSAFEDYRIFKYHMRNHNIFGVNDQSDLDSIPDLSSFRNIHLVLSHNKLADPEGKIPTFIVNNGFKLCDVIGHEPGTIIQIYRKANANCQSLILEESGTVYRGTCYAWEKSKLFDQVSGSRIDMYQGPTKIDGKCQELPNKLNSVFNINDGFAFGPTLEVKSTSCRKIEFKIVFSNPENAQAQMIITSYDEDEEMSYDVLNVANDKANSGLDSLIFKQGFWNPNNEARRYRAYVWNEGNKTFTLKKMQVSIWED